MEAGYTMPEVGTIRLPKVGTMSGIVCSPSGDIFVSQGPVIWILDRLKLTAEPYAGSSEGHESREGHRLKVARLKRSRGFSISDLGFFVCDTDDNRVRKFEGDDLLYFAGTGEAGMADGPTFAALFRQPCSIVAFRELLIVSDTGNHKIRFISPDGMVTSIGTAINANLGPDGDFATCGFANPCMLCVSPMDTVLLSDGATQVLREIDMDKQTVKTLRPHIANSEDESIIDALLATSIPPPPIPMRDRTVRPKSTVPNVFQCPLGMVFDCLGFLYLANYSEHAILRIHYESWAVTTFVGGVSGNEDGPINKATTKWPNYVCLTKEGDLFWTEHMDNCVRFSLRCVSPWIEKQTDKIPSFASLIGDSTDDENFKAIFRHDLTFNPTNESRHQLQLHTNILNMSATYSTELLEAIKSLGMPFEAVRYFFLILYGQTSIELDNSILKALETARATHIALIVPITRQWKDYFETLFINSIFRLSSREICQLLQTLITELPLNCRTLQILISWIRTKLSQRAREQILFDNLNGTAISLSLLEKNHEAAIDISSIPIRMTQGPLDKALEAFASTLEWKKIQRTEHGPPQAPTNYLITNGAGEAIAVHNWVLYSRWPYFRSLMKSGLEESLSGELELSSSNFPSDFLLDFVKYLYSGRVVGDDRKIKIFVAEEACRWIMENGAQFNIFIDLEQTQANTGFEALVKRCQAVVASSSRSKGKIHKSPKSPKAPKSVQPESPVV